MKMTHCDNHPDRIAVATYRIIKLPLGARPFLIGYSASGYMVDLCEECNKNIPTKGGTT
jgi:hypothetical protein